MNDTGNEINLLKLDIEGFEFKVIENLIENDLIDIMNQITVEIHAARSIYLSKTDMESMLKSWKTMHSKGFQLVNYSPNWTMEREYSPNQQNYRNFDVTLIKPM